MTAFQASYSDFKIVKGRKVAQIILEVPLEAADNALAVLGGVPRPDAEVWVGVARLAKGIPPAAPQAEQPAKERRRFDELPLPQQAALLCQDERFQKWCKGRWIEWARHEKAGSLPETIACYYLYEECGIQSRSELATNPDAKREFGQLVLKYRREAGQMAEQR